MHSDANALTLTVDVRSKSEFDVSHLKGATHFDIDNREGHIAEFMKSNFASKVKAYGNSGISKINLICYCSVGGRSSKMAQLIQGRLVKCNSAAHLNVYNLEGGLFKWANENLPMVDKDGAPTAFVHVYNETFSEIVRKELRKCS